MRLETYALDFPTTIATGSPLRCADLITKYIQIANFTGAAVVQGSINGTDFEDVYTAAAGIAAITPSIVWIRMKRTTGGTGTAHLAGFGREG
jgi:hypothetical protein